MTDGTYRGLALVTRETNRLVLVSAIDGGEALLMDLARQVFGDAGLDWERLVSGCRVVEVEVSERMN